MTLHGGFMKTLSEAKTQVRKILNDYKQKKEKEGKAGWIEASAPLRDSLNGLKNKHTIPIRDHDELREAIDKLVNLIADYHYPYGQSTSNLRKQLLDVLQTIPTHKEYADYLQKNEIKLTISTLETENQQLKDKVHDLKSQLELLKKENKELDDLLVLTKNDKVNLVLQVEELNRQLESPISDNPQQNRQRPKPSYEALQPPYERATIAALADQSPKLGIFNAFSHAFGALDLVGPPSETKPTSNVRKFKLDYD